MIIKEKLTREQAIAEIKNWFKEKLDSKDVFSKQGLWVQALEVDSPCDELFCQESKTGKTYKTTSKTVKTLESAKEITASFLNMLLDVYPSAALKDLHIETGECYELNCYPDGGKRYRIEIYDD